MPDRLRAGTLVFGSSAILLLALLLGITTVGAQPLEAAKPATRSCSVAGLRYSEKQDGVTYTVAVANLRATVSSCSQARSLAATVARDILHETKVPARIGGLKVTIMEPCTGCAPETQVSAKSGQEVVTFTVQGGA